MRQVLTVVAAFITFIASLTALGLIAFGYELRDVSGRARPQPQPLRLADLVKNGAGDNAHVTLSDYKFGPPVAAPTRTGLDGAWIPLFAPGQRSKSAAPQALLFARRLRSQEELDALLKQTSFDALLVSELPRTSQRVRPAAQLYMMYPNLDPERTPVLTEPVLLIGSRALPAAWWFDPNLPRYTWGGAVLSVVMAVVAGLGWRRGRRLAEQAREEELADWKRRESEPRDPNVISVHRFTLKHSLFMIWGFGLAMGCMVLIALLCLEPAVRMALNGNGEAAIPGVLGILMLAGAAGLGAKLLLDYRFTVREITLLNEGIRWVRNKRTYTAAWTDIQSIFKEDRVYVTVGSGVRSGSVHKLTLRLNDGRVLRFDKNTLEHYNRFAETIQSIHSRQVVQRAEREIAETGAAKFGPISLLADAVKVGGAIVPWSDLERFEVAGGNLKFHAPKTFTFLKSREVPLKEIPNYVALVELLRPKAAAH